MKQSRGAMYRHLLHKYSHVGCPAAQMEDNCVHPGRCAENGRCLNLQPDNRNGEASDEDRSH